VKALDDLAAGRLGGEKGSLEAALKELLSARDQNRGEVDPHIADLLIASISEIIATIGQTTLDSNNTSLGVLEKLLQEYVAGNVSAHGAFEALRKQATQAVTDHYDGKRSQEIGNLGSFITKVASLLAANRSPCASHELTCFQIDPGAATRLTQTAQAVIDAL